MNDEQLFDEQRKIDGFHTKAIMAAIICAQADMGGPRAFRDVEEMESDADIQKRAVFAAQLADLLFTYTIPVDS